MVNGFRVSLASAQVTDLTLNQADSTVTLEVVVPMSAVAMDFKPGVRLRRK